MPIFLLIVGILFITAAVRGEHKLLFDTLKDDFSGPKNFIYWGIALFILGAIGYYKPAKPLSSAFLFLVILVLFISNKGFFQKFMEQVSYTTAPNKNQNNANWIGDLKTSLFRIEKELSQ